MISPEPAAASAELDPAPIRMGDLAAAAHGPGIGAVATFEGVIRPTEEGRPIRAIHYEAYEPMAREKLEAVARETLGKFGAATVRIRHRIGRIGVGEAAVGIAVGAARRVSAFDACRFAIERIKEIVPIWKVEFEEET